MIKPEFENALLARRSQIRGRWQELLFVEPVTTALANPQMLSYLLDHSMDTVFAALRGDEPAAVPAVPRCACGRNPFLAYFRAGRQAWLEAMVHVLADAAPVAAGERDRAFAVVTSAIDSVARNEIEAFGSLCRHRTTPLAEAERCADCPDHVGLP